MTFTKEERLVNVIIEESLYSEDIIFRCFYWYTGKYSVEIRKENSAFEISIKPKNGTAAFNPEETIEKIKQDLIDYKLRAIVLKETGAIRELIVAKAFAYYTEADAPNSDVSDPVGFHPEHIKLYE